MKKVLFKGVIVAACVLRICIEARVEFTNIQCKSYDPTFMDFEYCYIKAVNRSYKYISTKMNLYKVPVKDIHIRNELLLRANGYKPFLYNFTFDACKFLKSRKQIVVKYFFSFVKDYTNFNHSCPYDHPIYLQKMPISHVEYLATKVLPIPHGDYSFIGSYSSMNIVRGHIKVFLTLTG